jgi:Predicted hydrolases or acyltransferases (alpha/beta hydrolase superfamily)
MLRGWKIGLGALSAIALVSAIALYRENRADFGIPAFMLWRATTSKFHGGHRATINGISLYYETYGEGRPVLLVHGACAFLETMHYFITDLARDHLVIAVDSRGQGRSTDGLGPMTYTQMSADMIGLLDALEIPSVDVVGWSDGGIIGLDMAMLHPERVRRLVAISANYDVQGIDSSAFAPTAMAEIETDIRPWYDRNAPDPGRLPVLMKKIATMIRTEPNYTLADLSRIRSRTLVIAGETDIVRRAHTNALAHAISGAREIIVKGSSHRGPFEQPDEYNRLAREFLDGP